MKGYKIVRVGENGKYYSCHNTVARFKGEVEYKIGMEVFRKKSNGPLGVFKSKQAIRDLIERCYLKNHGTLEFENYFCWYASKQKPKFKVFLCEITLSKNNFTGFYLENGSIKGETVPNGNIFCESVKLLKEVEI